MKNHNKYFYPIVYFLTYLRIFFLNDMIFNKVYIITKTKTLKFHFVSLNVNTFMTRFTDYKGELLRWEKKKKGKEKKKRKASLSLKDIRIICKYTNIFQF